MGDTTRMSRWKLGSMVRINGLVHLLLNGVYWGYKPLIVTFYYLVAFFSIVIILPKLRYLHEWLIFMVNVILYMDPIWLAIWGLFSCGQMVTQPHGWYGSMDFSPPSTYVPFPLRTWRIIPGLVSVVNNHGDRKSPIPAVVGPLPNGRTLWCLVFSILLVMFGLFYHGTYISLTMKSPFGRKVFLGSVVPNHYLEDHPS